MTLEEDRLAQLGLTCVVRILPHDRSKSPHPLAQSVQPANYWYRQGFVDQSFLTAPISVISFQ